MKVAQVEVGVRKTRAEGAELRRLTLLLLACVWIYSQDLASAVVPGRAVWWGDKSLPTSMKPPTELTNVVAITPSMALRTDGSLIVWGNNDFGQLRVPEGATNIVAIAEGYGHRLALRRDGIVFAWGAGTNNTGDWLTCSYGQSMVPPGLSNVVGIAAGTRHSLALRADSTIVGWGFNYYGETNVPPGLSNVVAIASDLRADFNLALRADGTVVAWGYSYYGETNVPAGLTNVVSIAAGADHSLAVTSQGGVVAWGQNYSGQADVPFGLNNVIAVAAGRVHSLALEADGTVIAWGGNPFGQTVVPFGLTNVTSIGADDDLSWALNGGSIAFRTLPASLFVYSGWAATFTSEAVGAPPLTYQWQFNGSAIPGATNSSLALPVTDLTNAGGYSVLVSNAVSSLVSPAAFLSVSNTGPIITGQPVSQTVAAGWDVAYLGVAVEGSYPRWFQWRMDGTNIPGATSWALSWFDVGFADAGEYDVVISNAFGAVTSSSATLTVLPSAIKWWGDNRYGQRNVAPGVGDKLAIAAGLYHCLVLQSNGTVAAWGAAGYGDYGQADVPAGLSNVIAVAAGRAHSLALKSDGRVIAWGEDVRGQCQVPAGLTNVVAVAGGGTFSMALKTDGTVQLWGGWYAPVTNVPPGLSNVVAIAAGDSHCLALKRDGMVIGWGGSPAATVPAGLSNVLAVAAGYSHSLALKGDGTVVAWGISYQGMGGPVTPPEGLGNAVAIAAGGDYFGDHSLALKSDGTVLAWGCNSSGQTNVPSGLTNVSAIAAGGEYSLALQDTHPPAVHAALADPQWKSNRFSISVPTRCGKVDSLEYLDSVSCADWQGLQLLAGNGGPLALADLTATNVQRFYRVRQW